MKEYGIGTIFYEDEYKIGVEKMRNMKGEHIMTYRMYIGKNSTKDDPVLDMIKMSDGWYQLISYQKDKKLYIDVFSEDQ